MVDIDSLRSLLIWVTLPTFMVANTSRCPESHPNLLYRSPEVIPQWSSCSGVIILRGGIRSYL